MKAEITEKGIEIKGVLINKKVFQEEMSEYDLREREDQIDHLIEWISECGIDRESDKGLMKEDLKYLMKLSDEYIFSSISTNEYIAKSDNEEEFNDICDRILELNETFAETTKTEIVSSKRIAECPKGILSAKHYIGFKRCACFKEVKQ